jgi:hypothetical protein
MRAARNAEKGAPSRQTHSIGINFINIARNAEGHAGEPKERCVAAI